MDYNERSYVVMKKINNVHGRVKHGTIEESELIDLEVELDRFLDGGFDG